MPRNYSVAETIRRAKEKYEQTNLPEEPEEFIEHIPTVNEEPEIIAQEIVTKEPMPVIQAKVYYPPEEPEPEVKPQEEKPEGLLGKISKKLKWW